MRNRQVKRSVGSSAKSHFGFRQSGFTQFAKESVEQDIRKSDQVWFLIKDFLTKLF